ncbi:hypothetical protein RR48_14480 [Papilio machaon]|uniref:Uncharacterized protein n=1 Tax=Papilio machaon TaxID=76193 RepID=A0A194QKE0_PAPMA|nr:hypothetical protein RR48_14480 [Papilio machaon]
MTAESSHHTTTPLLAVLSPPSPASHDTHAPPAVAAPRNSHARRAREPRFSSVYVRLSALEDDALCHAHFTYYAVTN